MSLEHRKLPGAIKKLVAKGVVERITTETTKDYGIGRFLVKLRREEDNEYEAYEVFHFVEEHFCEIQLIKRIKKLSFSKQSLV